MPTASNVDVAPPPVAQSPAMSRPRDTAVRWVTGAIVLLVSAAVLLWLRGTHPVPTGDVGGYVQMLRHFLATGRVDFMRWCQPMFIGVLPIAAPWAFLFGTGMGSLSLMGIAFALLLLAGLYLLISRHTSPSVAALLCASLACFADFLSCAQTFMTDVPYAAYFVWFVLAHDLLTEHLPRDNRRTRWVWVLWGGAFLLAALTRPFILVAVPVFFLQWRFAGDGKRNLYRAAAISSATLAFVSFVIVAALGDNRFKPIEQTSLHEVLALHQYGRFNIQAMLLAMLGAGVMALPALLVSVEARKPRPATGDLCAAAAGLIVGLYYWRRGMVPCVLPFLSPTAIKAISLAQVVAASVGWVIIYRLFRASVRGTWGGLPPLLAVVVLSQFASMPIMQHPLFRHAMPAFIALAALVAVLGIRTVRPVAVLGVVALVAIMAAGNALSTWRSSVTEKTQWAAAQELLDSGVPLEQIDGGWGWFCYYQLHPGQRDEKGYQKRYYDMVEHARYSVGEKPALSGQITLREVPVPVSVGTPVKVTVVDRTPNALATPAAGGRVHVR